MDPGAPMIVRPSLGGMYTAPEHSALLGLGIIHFTVSINISPPTGDQQKA